MKRVLTLQDYSCLGRCSLTVALPTLSACGVETVGIPTSLLSNHTQFPEWSLLDLKDELPTIFAHWDKIGVRFDAIQTGYLTTAQIPLVEKAIEKYRGDGLVFVDPAMADHGKLYPGFDLTHVEAMRSLVAVADVAKPNVTEAELLTRKKAEDGYEALAEEVAALGPKTVILTGIERKEGTLSVLLYENKECHWFDIEKLPGVYHGTGDLYCAAALGAFLAKGSWQKAIEIANRFLSEAIRKTIEDKADGLLYGVEFEKAIPSLIEGLKK